MVEVKEEGIEERQERAYVQEIRSMLT